MKIGLYGNLTLDELDQDGKSLVRPGGSAFYSSLAASHLGARVSIVSNVGRDFPRNALSFINKRGIDVSGVKKLDGHTTRFRISYRGESRKLELVHSGEKLTPKRTLGSFQAIHLGPVFLEVGLETLSYARQHSKFLSVDVQGLLRAEGPRGVVRLQRRRIEPFLSKCNLVKATEDEARVIAPDATIVSVARRILHKGPQYVIITRGQSGSLLVEKGGDARQIPSVPEARIVDRTGAGDIFVGSWLATFLSLGDASWAGAVGSAFASLSIRAIGIAKFRFTREELFRRAARAYDNLRIVKG
ncbi:MAG TPA: PfkB family carbohydrate kinase [Candidatus Bathyarchaeia archaeon]|nr:PfkB family carbohydrate kinase [Candidatus Bathyarchaeia archaeon]